MGVKTLLLLGLLLAMVPATAPALPGDADQEINIQADAWDADRRTGRAVYRGNVVVTSGGMELRGDELILNFTNETLTSAVLTGSPAQFAQDHADGRPATSAQASILTYEMESAMVRLRGDARVIQDRDEFASDDIRYDIRNERVAAGGEGSGRVQVTIQPRRPPAEPEPQP